MGRALADEAESTLPLVDQANANAYIDALGRQLASHAPGEKYPYQFKIIDDNGINTFALPGGFIYVTRGLVEAAQSEPQLAGVLAHQIGHVALRHGTQQVSRAYADQVPNAASRKVSVESAMARLDIAFDENSMVLKYPREAERQADLVATQIMVDTGFDPRQMAQFFQRISDERTSLTTQFFNNHPNLPNRAARIRGELANMGGLPRNVRGDSPDFHSVQRHLMANASSSVDRDRATVKPDRSSSRMVLYRWRDLEFRYPENWRVNEEGEALSVTPDGGIVSGALAYGMRIATFEPRNTSFFGEKGLTVPTDRSSRTSLSRGTDQLIDELRQSNPNMDVVRSDERRRVDGETAMTIELTNDSPTGGREVNWLVTVLRPNGLLYYFVGVAPQREFSRYSSTFEQIVSSVRFRD